MCLIYILDGMESLSTNSVTNLNETGIAR